MTTSAPSIAVSVAAATGTPLPCGSDAGLGKIETSDGVSRLHQIDSHGQAHMPQPNKSDGLHGLILLSIVREDHVGGFFRNHDGRRIGVS